MNNTIIIYEILFKILNNFILRPDPFDDYLRVFDLCERSIGTICPNYNMILIEEGYLSREQENELSLIGFKIILESGLPF